MHITGGCCGIAHDLAAVIDAHGFSSNLPQVAQVGYGASGVEEGMHSIAGVVIAHNLAAIINVGGIAYGSSQAAQGAQVGQGAAGIEDGMVFWVYDVFPHDLAMVIDGAGREISYVGQGASGVKEGMVITGKYPRDLAVVINGVSLRITIPCKVPIQRVILIHQVADVGHGAPGGEEGSRNALGINGIAHDLAAVIDAVSPASIATQGAQVGHVALGVEKGMSITSGCG